MLKLNDIRGAEGSTHYVKRLGRGVGSGHGNTSGKGHKGLLARKGGGRRLGYEGGQTPLARRIPKRGFHNFTRVVYAVINLDTIDSLGITEVSVEKLKSIGWLKRNKPLKVLGTGSVKKAVQVKVHKCSALAKEKIEKAGGKVEVLDVRG